MPRRFQTTFLGSRAVVGNLVGEGLLAAADKDGRSLADVLYMHGFDGSPAAVGRIAMKPQDVSGCAASGACFVRLKPQHLLGCFTLCPIEDASLAACCWHAI